jgi:class 3 adenylate cyclase/tetratricopeptide (TPR) repeat protein
VSVCAACGHENQRDARFCSACGAAIERASTPTLEERKIVTAVFVDLVDFTSRAEHSDPEDVRAFLSPYYARLRSELEHFGGTVEKFIGDAVMALFGAPTTHEDDPERAVRAALAIRDWVVDDGLLKVRIGVNTGEALITLRARPAEGEGMAAGDVVNTAARLQSAAPVNGVLVGETTYRATRHVLEYRSAEPVHAKGKESPVVAWEAVQARPRFGVDVPHDARTELIGRDGELRLLTDAFHRARRERSTQLVTIVGVPGIGKSRLLYELSRVVDAEPEFISWRQGRSLPYGEGVSFWALAEMVKAQAGILESDDQAAVEVKLAAMVADAVPEHSDAEWVLRHTKVLLGLADQASVSGDQRAEAFAGWRRLFEGLAERRPLVALFEDLHWADDGLLDFVDYLVDWVAGVPLLVVCSARPELFERRPGWGGGKPNAVTISLAPLSEDDTARLIGSLMGSPVLEAEAQRQLLARAGGNPLYAEQFVQMYAEHADIPASTLPHSVQGIVSARLDALAPQEKRLIHDASVIGKVFWPGAVAALNGDVDRFGLEGALHVLERKQFVRRERQSSIAGETQYAFGHVLLRDVAYGQIPRAARASKHALAAGWIDSLGRPDEHAEMLAHHYVSALELARAAGQDATEFAARARVAMRDAGDRARRLSAYPAAAKFYREALALYPDDLLEERADVLFGLAIASARGGDEDPTEALETARAALLAIGDRPRVGAVDAELGQLWWERGEQDRCFEYGERAYEFVRDSPPSAEKAAVLVRLARHQMLADALDPQLADEAVALCDLLGLEEARADILVTIGTARAGNGDASGTVEIRRGLDMALAGNYLQTAIRGYSNLSALAERAGDFQASVAIAREADSISRRLGSQRWRRWARANQVSMNLGIGDWDECARVADEVIGQLQSQGPHYLDAHVFAARACLRLAREHVQAAVEDQTAALACARRVKDPQVLCPVLAVAAYVLAEAGHHDESRELLDELLHAPPDHAIDELTHAAPGLALAATTIGRRDELRAWLGPVGGSSWAVTARAILDDEFAAAIAALEPSGAVYPLSLVRLRAAERLAADGRRKEAEVILRPALAFFRSVGATRHLRAADALLAA